MRCAACAPELPFSVLAEVGLKGQQEFGGGKVLVFASFSFVPLARIEPFPGLLVW